MAHRTLHLYHGYMTSPSPLKIADNRVLKFFPSTVKSPKRLTLDQIQQYNDKGYLTGLNVYDEAGIKANRQAFEAILAATLADGRDAYAINGYHTRCQSIYDLVVNPIICDYVADILGPDFVCWGTHYFCKMPHDPRPVPWHQDASYWPLSPSKTVTVWLAIDDSDQGNSAMKVVPGTHRLGPLPFDKAPPELRPVLWQQVTGVEKMGEPTHIVLKAGQISLHSDLLVHGSDPNPSDRRRCGLTMRFATTDVRSTAGWNSNAILCRGVDHENYWVNRPRPAGEDFGPMTEKVANARG